jgi:drug/metabolite transporter (DMT)-like permease
VALSLAVEGSPLQFSWTPTTLIALAYLVVAGSVVAFWLNYWLLARMPVHNVLLMAVVEPVIAVALGAAILDERVTLLTAAGVTLILAASSVVLFRRGGTIESAAAP